jgi:hypothetical protein
MPNAAQDALAEVTPWPRRSPRGTIRNWSLSGRRRRGHPTAGCSSSDPSCKHMSRGWCPHRGRRYIPAWIGPGSTRAPYRSGRMRTCLPLGDTSYSTADCSRSDPCCKRNSQSWSYCIRPNRWRCSSLPWDTRRIPGRRPGPRTWRPKLSCSTSDRPARRWRRRTLRRSDRYSPAPRGRRSTDPWWFRPPRILRPRMPRPERALRRCRHRPRRHRTRAPARHSHRSLAGRRRRFLQRSMWAPPRCRRCPATLRRLSIKESNVEISSGESPGLSTLLGHSGQFRHEKTGRLGSGRD